MSQQFFYNIVWIAFFVVATFFLIFIIRRVNDNRQKKREQMAEHLEKKIRYDDLSEEVLEEAGEEDRTEAVLYSLITLEDKDEDYFEHMNEEQRTIYGIYNLNQTVSGKSGLRSFFISPAYADFVPYIDRYYENINMPQVAELLRAARHLNEILENNLEDDFDEDDDYATYNFGDFTHEYITMVAGTNFEAKIADYIENHKESFVMSEGKKENEEEEDNADEESGSEV